MALQRQHPFPSGRSHSNTTSFARSISTNAESYSSHPSQPMSQESLFSRATKSCYDQEIVVETQRFLSFLKNYLDLFTDQTIFTPTEKSQFRVAQVLHRSLLRLGTNPANTDPQHFACADVSRIIDSLSCCHLSKLPTCTDNAPWSLKILSDSKDKILQLRDKAAEADARPSPYYFGTRTTWHKMQSSPSAILCHRPASNRPHFPLEIMHPAFYEFMKEIRLLDHGEQLLFRRIAADLATALASPLSVGSDRSTRVLTVLNKIFPDQSPFKWTSRKRTNEFFYQKLRSEDCPSDTNLMAIVIKLEDSEFGDSFMHISRTYDDIIEKNRKNPNRCDTGTPMFLIAMAGPNIKICGGWADNPLTGPSVDVFKVHFACLDVANRHLNELAKSLCSLSKAITYLPSYHIPGSDNRITPDVPSIFTTYGEVETEIPKLPLKLLHRLKDDACYSVFTAHSPDLPHTQENEPNCVAKLVFDHYGPEVHQALAPEFAPKLFGRSSKPGLNYRVYIMEYLEPCVGADGWISLLGLRRGLATVAGLEDQIITILEKIVKRLQNLKLVHGDLRPNNLMIKMSAPYIVANPVAIKVVDFEWADRSGVARYPENRNECAGYPGEAGGLIEQAHDGFMIEKFLKEWS